LRLRHDPKIRIVDILFFIIFGIVKNMLKIKLIKYIKIIHCAKIIILKCLKSI